ESEKNYDQAAEYYSEGLKLKEAGVGADSVELVPILINYGKLQQNRGKIDDAQVLVERAVTIRRKAKDTNPAELAVNVTTLAQILAL
ncbi:tetratricopeptide repeat protein, partial [Acinetobacter baumannii]